jgi:peptide chain release factor 1
MVNIDAVKKEYEELLAQLSDPELISDWIKFEELTKRKNSLEKIIEKEKELEELRNKIEENKSIISAKEDPELIALAEAEIIQLKERVKILEKELQNEGQERDNPSKFGSVIVEIRAGTGGEEAALFAADLFKMYTKYAKSQDWEIKVFDSHPTELGGFKEVIFELKSGEVYSKMKYEAGVHRVQRIPKTEKAGRIHTSTATVAILPKPKKSEIKIRPDDLKIEFYRASGPGGQYVNKKETAVRIWHLPTGLAVTSQTERSQAQNKENALSILEARLSEKIREKEEIKLSKERKTQIGWAKRAEKIRTYNFPQDRLTDHRLKKSWHNLEEIMEGKLKPIVSSLQKNLGNNL